ncbi:Carboxypeptidase [Pleurotus pulmonarius]
MVAIRLCYLIGIAALVQGLQTTHDALVVQDSDSTHHGSDPFTAEVTLDALSDKEFTTLRHPAFPGYGVRVKRTHWCDETVKAYTGYIDIQARHIFFSFFESRSDPDADDVIFWTNGGPGCSSSAGLLSLDQSWTSNVNIFFIDQPIGTGFSYADFGETVSTTEDAAKDIAAFVPVFFEHFTKFKGRAFHMAGESYAGRYLPVYASAVYDQNARLIQQGLTPINLVSVMIGNGWTDMPSILLTWPDFQCSRFPIAPLLDISTCVKMKRILPRCRQWIQSSCIDHFDDIDCYAAAETCDAAFGFPHYQTGRNPYDVSKPCEGGIGTLCYPIMQNITRYLNSSHTRDLLGVDPAVTSFSSSSVEYVPQLLERDIHILIYVGSYDWLAHWIGNERWTLDIEWSGKREFNEQPLRDWVVDGKVAGRTRSAKGLTFTTVEGAGHLVPYDKPLESLALVQRWLAGRTL